MAQGTNVELMAMVDVLIPSFVRHERFWQVWGFLRKFHTCRLAERPEARRSAGRRSGIPEVWIPAKPHCRHAPRTKIL